MQIFRPVVLFAAFTLVVVDAQHEMEMPEGEMDEADSYNPSDPIQLEDMITQDQLKKLFEKIDGHGAGKVSVKDLEDFSHTMRHKRANQYPDESFADLDADGDGKVTFDEASRHMGMMDDSEMPEADRESEQARMKAMFEASDKNSDGTLDKNEAVFFVHHDADPAVEEAVARAELKLKDNNGDGQLDKVEATEVMGEESVETHFDKLDMDKDGFLSAKEFLLWETGRIFEQDGWVELMEQADADKDGFVTLEELLKSRQQEEHRAHHMNYEYWAHELEL